MVSSKSVLIVEDDENVRELLASLLEVDFQVSCAGTIADAIECLNQHQPNIIVCDARLPDYDGYTFVAESRADQRTAKIPVVMMSGWEDGTCEQRARAAGAVAFLPKPFRPAELLDLMTLHLPSSTARQAA